MNNTLTESIQAAAARSGQAEYRYDCPNCSKRKNDKTGSYNPGKGVGHCHRCGWTLKGPRPENFITKTVDDLERERRNRTWKITQILQATKPIEPVGPLTKYLYNRLGCEIPELPKLAYNPAVRHYTGRNLYTTSPAMLAALRDVDGRLTGLHITHIRNGQKAYGSDSRRYCKLRSMKGSAVRLYPLRADVLIVAEGIETALALRLVTHDPIWACASASLLTAFEPPPEVRRLIIAADNDSNGVGQKAAWALYKRLQGRCRCTVLIPDRENSDWLDAIRGATR